MYSESSAFWLSALCSRLEHCLAVHAEEENPAEFSGLVAYERWETTPYEVLRRCADDFGISGSSELQLLPVDARPPAPDDTVWVSARTGKVLAPDALAAQAAELADSYRLAELDVQESQSSDRRSRYLELLAESVFPVFAYGTSPSYPHYQYRLSLKGATEAWKVVPEQPRTLYSAVVRELHPVMPIAMAELIACGLRVDLRELLPLQPFLISTEIGKLDTAACRAVMQTYARDCKSNVGWAIANCFWVLQGKVSRLDSYLASPTASEETSSPSDVVGSQGAGGAVDQAPDSDVEQESSSSLLDLVRAMKETEPADDQFIGVEQDAHDEVLACFDEAIRLCDAAGLPNATTVLRNAREACAIDAETWAAGRWWLDLLAPKLRERADRRGTVLESITAAEKMVYGELRLRELKWDDAALTEPALQGWVTQSEDIRAAIKVGVEQLNNGMRPFVVMSQVAGAVEVLVRQLAAKHLTEFRGLSSGGLLNELRKSIGRDVDAHEERVTLSVAQALVSMRNWVAHPADAKWDRDHAAFFLNGLSLLLRQV